MQKESPSALKWRGAPVWSQDGIICTGETYKNVVKMTFAKGASLEDPSGFSTRVSTGTSGARSTFTKATRSTRRRSRLSSAPLWR